MHRRMSLNECTRERAGVAESEACGRLRAVSERCNRLEAVSVGATRAVFCKRQQCDLYFGVVLWGRSG